MKPNLLKRSWSNGVATVNGWLSIGNAFTAEIMAEQGYDSLTIDVQHGFLDYADAKGMLQAIRASQKTPLVRVPWLEPGIIMKCLDAGAHGVICPMINTPDQAAALVDAVRYPPLGNRSFGPTRANISAGPGYFAGANENVLAIAMIETDEGVQNVEAIARVPGIDALYIGPGDLALGISHGRLQPGLDREEEEAREAILRIRDAARAAGISSGIHCGTPEYAARSVDWGFDMVTISSDVRLLVAAAATSLGRFQGLTGRTPTGEQDDSGGY